MKFLKLFEKRHMGQITNTFLAPIRDGIHDHEKIMDWIKEDLERQKHRKEWINGYTGRTLNVALKPHYKILEDNLDSPHLKEFLEYYIAYSKLSYEDQQVAKKVKVARKNKLKQLKDFINSKRPLSWSALESFRYDPAQFYENYILGKKKLANAAMEFGSMIDVKIQEDRTFLRELPRYPEMQHRLQVVLDGIPLVGIADGIDFTDFHLADYKTGQKKWDQKRADETGQLTMYLLMIYITRKILPEKFRCFIHWLPTKEDGNFKMTLVEPVKVKTFETKRTMTDLLVFAKYIKETYTAMEKFVKDHE